MKKYHLITYHPECDYDDKEDVDTMEEATRLANAYLNDLYDTIYVFNEEKRKLQRVFDQLSRKGRRPFDCEIKKFIP